MLLRVIKELVTGVLCMRGSRVVSSGAILPPKCMSQSGLFFFLTKCMSCRIKKFGKNKLMKKRGI